MIHTRNGTSCIATVKSRRVTLVCILHGTNGNLLSRPTCTVYVPIAESRFSDDCTGPLAATEHDTRECRFLQKRTSTKGVAYASMRCDPTTTYSTHPPRFPIPKTRPDGLIVHTYSKHYWHCSLYLSAQPRVLIDAITACADLIDMVRLAKLGGSSSLTAHDMLAR